ncbi:MAG: hypothetical protein C0436_05555, partial [Alphaproteobacteria bacterium]|nr:hypothetical protein [Alphaproteobacteria bacterium]
MVGVRPQSQVRLEELLAGPRPQPLPATAPPRPAPVNPVLAQGPMQGPPVPFERLPTGPADLNAMLQRSVEEGTADNARRAEANLARVAEARQQDTAALIAAGLSPEAAAAEAARVRPQGAPAQAPASAEAAPSSESGPTPPGTSSELPLPPPPTPPPGSGAGGTDPIETALRGLMAGGGGGGSRGGVPAASGNYPSLASIPRPDSNAILAQYDQARPQTQAANTDEMHMAGLLGALAGIQMRPGQRLGFGLQGAMAGGAEGYGNERQRQRQDLRMDAREQRQHAAGRASLQAQLEGQDYTRQTDVQRFDQANRFHQES